MGTVIDHNVETGEIVERPQTNEEIEQANEDAKSFAKIDTEKIAKEEAKKAVLIRLGITADEAKLLIS